MNSHKKFFQTFKDLQPIFLKLSYIIDRGGIFSNSFYEDSITLMSKPRKDTTKYKLWTNIPDEQKFKNPQ